MTWRLEAAYRDETNGCINPYLRPGGARHTGNPRDLTGLDVTGGACGFGQGTLRWPLNWHSCGLVGPEDVYDDLTAMDLTFSVRFFILLHFYTRPSWAKGKWALRAACVWAIHASELGETTFTTI